MVTVQQIQTGFAAFIDNYVAAAYSGIEKVLVIGASTLLAANFPNLLKQYENHPMVCALGVVRPESGSVDIDSLYNAFAPRMGAEKIPIQLPRIGKLDLGTIKLGKEEVDILYRLIKEA